MDKQIMKRLAPLFEEIAQMNNLHAEREAKKDPLAHKLTRVMKDTAYRYFPNVDGRGSRVLFCYSSHRNVAGFFLGWRETHFKNGKVKRDMWLSRRSRKRCKEIALRRSTAFKKRHAKPDPAPV